MYADKISTEIGDFFLLANDNFITGAYFEGEGDVNVEISTSPLLQMAKFELIEYFEGKRKEFTFPIFQEGTPFRMKVWNELRNIPYGETRSYKEVAIACGNDKASRAVGNANNKNTIGIIVPCHRVIGTDKKLVGYASGVHRKEFLLNLEKENS